MGVRKEVAKPIDKGIWESLKLYVYVIGVAACIGLAAKYSLNWLVVNAIDISVYIYI